MTRTEQPARTEQPRTEQPPPSTQPGPGPTGPAPIQYRATRNHP
ncbi:hypothetical protein ACWDQL_06250 [Streptomyces olivaceus]